MADDVMAVDERVTNLEVTVAKGFQELGGRMDRLESRMDRLESRMDRLDERMDRLDERMDRLDERMDAFNGKLDAAVESLEGKMDLVLERLDLHMAEMKATTTAMARESRADRRLMFAMLKDHRVRIEALESAAREEA